MKVRDMLKRLADEGWVLDRTRGDEEMRRYAVIFEKAPGNWCAYVPDLPGCVATGPTIERARRSIAEAIEFHVEGLKLHGYPVPEPVTRAEEIEVGGSVAA